MNKEVYLVRHLATDYNKSGVFMGRRYDLPVDKNEAKLFVSGFLRDLLKYNSKAVIYSSPALRCQQTAKLLKDKLGIDSYVEIRGEFNETDYGEFEGKNAEQIRSMFPKELDVLMEKPSRVKFPGGESLQNVQERSWRGLQEIATNGLVGESIFICTHVDVIKGILFKIMGVSFDAKRFLHIDNGSISGLEVSDGGVIKVKFTNLR